MTLKRSLFTAVLMAALLTGAALPALAQGGGDADPLGGATEFAKAPERTAVTLILDWTPNTNHTGFFVAQALGYYDEANLDVSIQQPTDLLVEAVVTSGAAEFGVSYQEFMTYALADGLPLASLAAIIQHNTSGFVSLADSHPLTRPADMAGLTYGGFGQPDLENAVIDRLLTCDGAEPGTVAYVDVGYVDAITLMQQGRFDLSWMYYAWTGLEAERRGVDLDAIMLADYPDCVPDYYTPILITTQNMIAQSPEVVAAFVQATARGFAYAIQHPDEAADILIEAAPEADPDLIRASAAWLAPRYQDDAPRWGQQSAETWQGFTDFLVENGILAEPLDVSAAFTNDFLPGTVESSGR